MNYLELTNIVRNKYKKPDLELSDIEFALEEIETVILNYCQLSEVPKALKFTWCNMAVDLLRYTLEVNTAPDSDLGSIDVSDVSTIKLGDTSVTLGDKYKSNQRSRTLQSHQANLDAVTMHYKSQLNQFRRIW